MHFLSCFEVFILCIEWTYSRKYNFNLYVIRFSYYFELGIWLDFIPAVPFQSSFNKYNTACNWFGRVYFREMKGVLTF